MKNKVREPKTANKAGLSISWAELARFAEAIHIAREELLAPAEEITERFALGPRGVWIIGLVATGRIRTQADVAKLYRIGRSMVTEQVSLLIKQGLIISEQNTEDRRKKNIILTELGWSVNQQLGDAFMKIIKERIGHYSLKQFICCIDLLSDLAGTRSLPI